MSLINQFTRYFGPMRPDLTAAQLKERIDRDSIIRYGRFRITDGDRMRTAALIEYDPVARDNSFIKCELFPDANANRRNLPDQPVRQTYYGQLIDIYHLLWIEDDGCKRTRYVLAGVRMCNTRTLDAALPENPRVTFKMSQLRGNPEMIHIETIISAVGRVHVGGDEWAIIDRSRENMRTQFVDPDDIPELE
ncbi:hypothetical protein FRC12_024465 [Ceratobasidium sp. 428]|nr:hypothetical protein FRC12_024465 [Ceratobasidium sp. 428]